MMLHTVTMMCNEVPLVMMYIVPVVMPRVWLALDSGSVIHQCGAEMFLHKLWGHCTSGHGYSVVAT